MEIRERFFYVPRKKSFKTKENTSMNRYTKRIKAVVWVSGLLTAVSCAGYAGVPLNNLEGVGGIAFNPLAYTAGQPLGQDSEIGKYVSKGQYGAWYVHLDQPNDVTHNKVDWSNIGAAFTVAKRLELSYGFQDVDLAGAANIHKSNIGLKASLIKENEWGLNYVPALSVGAIYKDTNYAGAHLDHAWDYYLVATKLVKETPVPVLLSAGALSTRGIVTGVLGFDDQRDTTFFANADVLPLSSLALGYEFKRGVSYSDWHDANYYDLHAAWFATSNLTLVAAFVNAGEHTQLPNAGFGLGKGVVLSSQYAF
jgi:hypothetical protein